MIKYKILTNFWHIYWWHMHPLWQYSLNIPSQCDWDFAGVTFDFAFLGRSSARRTRSEANVWPSLLRGHKTGDCSATTTCPTKKRTVLSSARQARSNGTTFVNIGWNSSGCDYLARVDPWASPQSSSYGLNKNKANPPNWQVRVVRRAAHKVLEIDLIIRSYIRPFCRGVGRRRGARGECFV